jgi:predicted HTH transcriptional regulator
VNPRRAEDAELVELLRQGESREVEFKKRIPDARIAAREMAAIANSGSGRLIVGVEEGLGAIGLEDPESTRRLIDNAIHLIEPPPHVDTYVREVNGRAVVVADVQGPSPPYVGPDGAIARRASDGARLAFSGAELQAAFRDKAAAAARPPDEEIAEALERMNTQLEEANSRLQETLQQLYEERQLAARERSEAQRARGWRALLVGWAVSGLIGAAIGAALAALL